MADPEAAGDSRAEAALLAAAGLREAGRSEKPFYHRGARAYPCRYRGGRAAHFSRPRHRGYSRQRPLFDVSDRLGGGRRSDDRVIVALLWPEIRVRSAIVIQVVVLIALTAAFDWLPIRIALVPDSLKRARAHQLARREFAASIDANGARRHRILLFVSLAEHYVEIIADRQTHMLVAEGTWDKIVADFVAAVKRGRVFDGVMCAIEACAGVLETHHPQPAETRG